MSPSNHRHRPDGQGHLSLALLLVSLHLPGGLGYLFAPPPLELKEWYPNGTDGKAVRVRGSLYVYKGYSIQLVCSIEGELGCGPEQLGFRRNNTPVDPSFVRVLDDRSAVMVLPNVGYNESFAFHCGLPEPCDEHNGMVVVVAVEPIKPEFVESPCVIENWRELNCSWYPSLYTQYTHSNIAPYRSHIDMISVNGTSIRFPRCDDSISRQADVWKRNESCQVDLDENHVTSVVNMTVKVTNVMGYKKSDHLIIDLKDIVKPSPIISKSIKATKVNETHAKITWDSPVPEFYEKLVPNLILQYTVEATYVYQADPQNTTYALDAMVTETEELVLPIEVYAAYSMQIVSRVLSGGPRSELQTFKFSTAPQVPASNPKLFKAVYTPGHPKVQGERTVSVFWEPLPYNVQNGPGLKYNIIATPEAPSGLAIEAKTSESYESLDLDSSMSYFIRIRAINSQGASSASANELYLRSYEKMVPSVDMKRFIVEAADTKAFLRWRNVTDAASYTLYKCSYNHELICKDRIDTVDVHGNLSEYTWELKEHYRRFMFGIAVKSENRVYSYIRMAPCSYLRTAAPEAVAELRTMTTGLDYGEARVTWALHECDTKHGFPSMICVYYCPLIDTNICDELPSSHCLSSQMTGVTLKNLVQGATYNVTVVTVTSLNNISLPVTTLTLKVQSDWKSVGAYIGIAVGVVVCLILLALGVKALLSSCKRYWKKYSGGITIQLPEHSRYPLSSTSSETPFLPYAFNGSSPTSAGTTSNGEFVFPKDEEAQCMMTPYTTVSPRKDETRMNLNSSSPQRLLLSDEHPDDFDGDDSVFDDSYGAPTNLKELHAADMEIKDSGHVDSAPGTSTGNHQKTIHAKVNTNSGADEPAIDINFNLDEADHASQGEGAVREREGATGDPDSGFPGKQDSFNPYTPLNNFHQIHLPPYAEAAPPSHSGQSVSSTDLLPDSSSTAYTAGVPGTDVSLSPAAPQPQVMAPDASGYVSHDCPILLPTQQDADTTYRDSEDSEEDSDDNTTVVGITVPAFIPANNGYVTVPV